MKKKSEKMKRLFLILGITGWLLSGWSGFAYWWTRDHDLKKDDIPVLLLEGALGPFAWGIGYLFHSENQILIPNQNEKEK